jgi:L-fucose dehydrogenase
MNLNLKDKAVIVTGGASGIGEAIVRELAQEGAIPIIVNRGAERGKKIEDELKSQGHECLFIQAELSQEENCRTIIEKTLEKYGHIDALVNNAGKNDSIGLEKGTPAGFMESLQNNLSHYYAMAHYALPALIKSKGSIVNISSKTGVTGQGNTSGYVAAKSAQLGLTREWATELLPYEIRVNAVIPAEVMTPLYENWIKTFENPEARLKQITDKIPLGKRMTTSEEIAYAVLFLISKKASHITGQHWFVDGGYTHLDRAIE